mgnify:CR=1 FL=1
MDLERSIELASLLQDETVLQDYEIRYAKSNGMKHHLRKTFPYMFGKIKEHIRKYNDELRD